MAPAPARAAARRRGGRVRNRALDGATDHGGRRAPLRRAVPPALTRPSAARPRLEPAGAHCPRAGAGRGAHRSVAQAGLAAHKKGARRSGRAILFIDETGHTFLARLSTTWAPVGQPPLLRRVSQRRELSSIVALVAPVGRPARLYARHFRGSIHGAQV